jgi:hypothetical protein
VPIKPEKESKVIDVVSSETGVAPSPSSAAWSWRRRAGRLELKSRVAAHPMLFGCWFVLQGYAMLQPMGRIQDLFFYLAAFSGAIFLLELGLMLFIRHPRKPALLASLCVVFFCFYGDWRMGLARWMPVWLASTRWLLPMAGMVFLALCLWVLRTPRTLVTTRRYLDAVSTLLIALALAGILRAPARPVIPSGPLAATPLVLGAHPPDIYYILTDAYTSPESLKTYWGYDDSAFINNLAALGFRVVPNARANATHTPVCLSTYLNMDYPPAPPANWPLPAQEAYYSQIIRQAEAPSRLKASGYEIRALSIFEVAGQPPYYTYPWITDPTLGSVLWDRMALGYLHAYYLRAGMGEINLRLFSLLPKFAAERSPKPKFVYCHLMMPHWPYLFDEKGRRVQRGMRPSDDRPEDYLSQLIYENTLLTNALAGILKNSQTPPIIIVQGDHGYRGIPGPHRAEEAATILNALYLPGSEGDWLHPGITPVNTFRLIFDRYFGQHYNYLPDLAPTGVSPLAGSGDER